MNFLYKGKAIDSLMTKKLHEFFGFNISDHCCSNYICSIKILDKDTIRLDTGKYTAEYVLFYNGYNLEVLYRINRSVVLKNKHTKRIELEHSYYALTYKQEEAFKKCCKNLCCTYVRYLSWSHIGLTIVILGVYIYFTVKLSRYWGWYILGAAIAYTIVLIFMDSIEQLYKEKSESELRAKITTSNDNLYGTLKPVLKTITQTMEDTVGYEFIGHGDDNVQYSYKI